MAKDIIAVIGARKVGKTEAIETLQRCSFGYSVTSPNYWAIKDFVTVNDMTLDDFFFHPSAGGDINFETHKRLMLLFKENQECHNPKKYLDMMDEEIFNLDRVLIDDIYTYDELCHVINLGARLILIHADQRKRDEMGYIKGMDNEFYVNEVGSITPDDVTNWKHTTVITNNGALDRFRFSLRSFI